MGDSQPAERRSARTCLSSAGSGSGSGRGPGPGGSRPAGGGETERHGERRADGGDKGARGRAGRRRAHLESPACSCTAGLCSWWPPAGDVRRRARGRGAATSVEAEAGLRGDRPSARRRLPRPRSQQPIGARRAHARPSAARGGGVLSTPTHTLPRSPRPLGYALSSIRPGCSVHCPTLCPTSSALLPRPRL